MKLLPALRVSIVAAFLVACAAPVAKGEHPVSQPEATGVLAGSVSRGPLTPHEPVGGRSRRAQVAGARIDIATADDTPVTSVETDSLGDFKLNLPPGTYRLTMPSLHGARPRNLPATVTITPGQEQRLDLYLDTGLR
jgi:hypothetical protein